MLRLGSECSATQFDDGKHGTHSRVLHTQEARFLMFPGQSGHLLLPG